jgi:phenylalanyl-tRNA synthetase beta chain
MLTDMEFIELLNPSNVEYNILRSWMIPSLMKVLGENTRHDYPQKIFDIGTVFKKNPKTETGVEELTRIACISCHKDANYTEIRQYLDYLLSSLGLKYKVVKTEHPSFIPGRAGRVSVKGKKVAYIGEIHPQVLDNFGIEQPVCVFELNLTDLFEIIKK